MVDTCTHLAVQQNQGFCVVPNSFGTTLDRYHVASPYRKMSTTIISIT